MDNVTASEIAGLGVGTLLLCAAMAAPKVDAFISASQRSSLGMCKRCGNLKMIACTKCRGVGSIKDGQLRFGILNDLYEWIDTEESKAQSTPCEKCRGRGHFNCPDCFKTKP